MPQQQADAEDDYTIGVEPEEIHHLICDRRYLSRTLNCVNACFLASFVAMVAFKSGILYSEFYSRPASHSHLHRDSKENAVLPRQNSTLTDWGHSTRFHGWVDVQNQSVPNDYARYVGPKDEHPFVWLSIALAGSTEQYTQPGLYEENSGIVKRTLVKPRQIISDIGKLGLPNYFKGWVDVQNQGVANDYAYYVGATDDIPFPWLTVALAGSSQQRTCVGLYIENYGVVRPTLEEIHYKQSTDISCCEFWKSMICKFFHTSSNHDSYQSNPFLDFSELDIQQMVVENLSDNNTSNVTLITLWRKLLPKDVGRALASPRAYNNSTFTTVYVELLRAIIDLLCFTTCSDLQEWFSLFLYKNVTH